MGGLAPHLSSMLKLIAVWNWAVASRVFSWQRFLSITLQPSTESCGVQWPRTGCLSRVEGWITWLSLPHKMGFSLCYFTWGHCNSSLKEQIPFVSNSILCGMFFTNNEVSICIVVVYFSFWVGKELLVRGVVIPVACCSLWRRLMYIVYSLREHPLSWYPG